MFYLSSVNSAQDRSPELSNSLRRQPASTIGTHIAKLYPILDKGKIQGVMKKSIFIFADFKLPLHPSPRGSVPINQCEKSAFLK